MGRPSVGTRAALRMDPDRQRSSASIREVAQISSNCPGGCTSAAPASDCERTPGRSKADCSSGCACEENTRPTQGRCVDQSEPVEGSHRSSGRRGCRGEASFAVIPPKSKAAGRSSPSLPPDRFDEGIHRTGQKTNPSRRREGSFGPGLHCRNALDEKEYDSRELPLAEARVGAALGRVSSNATRRSDTSGFGGIKSPVCNRWSTSCRPSAMHWRRESRNQ